MSLQWTLSFVMVSIHVSSANLCSPRYMFACAIHPELDLKRTTVCPTTLSYLITIDNGKYSTTVYDKRDDFNFCIVNFPH